MAKTLTRIRRPSWSAVVKAARRAWAKGDKIKVWVTTPTGAKRIAVVPFKFGGEIRYAYKFSFGVGAFWRPVFKSRLSALKANKKRIERDMAWAQRRVVQLAKRWRKVREALGG